MKIKIVVISDLHTADQCVKPTRRSDIADLLLSRTVDLLNHSIKPDVTLILGDMVQETEITPVRRHLQRLAPIVASLQYPCITLPGNHDPAPQIFYEYFPRPADTVDIKGFRFLPFIDTEEPDFNARRTDADIERMKAAPDGHSGPIISVQHVPLSPPEPPHCPYNLVNADQVISIMHQCGCRLAISGHFHEGMELITADSISFVAAPALCKPPFRFLEINIDADNIHTTTHQLHLLEE